MPIFICKNCGNLTESEEVTGLNCENCGASLVDSPKEPARPPLPIRIPLNQRSSDRRTPEPVTAPSTPPPPTQATDAPVPEVKQAEPTPEEAQETQSDKREQSPIELPESPAPKTPSRPPAVAGPPTSQTHVFSESSHELMEIYENTNLVACPQCSYGCDPTWGNCPICQAEISGLENLKKVSDSDPSDFVLDESELKKQLTPCPKCQYACDPGWDKCPICQTALNQTADSKSEGTSGEN